VPFGEYVPFENLLRGLIQFFNLPMSSFVEGPAHQPLIKVNKLYYVAPFICYEVAYSSLVRSDLPKAAILITISDDAWFGHSVAAWQHLQIGQMQALSTGREMLFDSNNGVTAFISDKGRILKQAPRFVPTVLTGKAVLYQGETPWVWLGNWPVILLAFLLLLLGFCLRKKKG
jgi:apolipoprotein N-acyltransferase